MIGSWWDAVDRMNEGPVDVRRIDRRWLQKKRRGQTLKIDPLILRMMLYGGGRAERGIKRKHQKIYTSNHYLPWTHLPTQPHTPSSFSSSLNVAIAKTPIPSVIK